MGLLSVLGLKPATKGQPTAKGTPTGPAAKTSATPSGNDDVALNADTSDAGGSGPGVDKNLAAFQQARDAVKKLVDGLDAHPQNARITPQIALAKAKLKDADDAAAAKDWKKATTALGEVKPIVNAAKKLADDWADYAKARAKTVALILTFKTNKNSVNTAMGVVTVTADGFAGQTPPDFANAKKTLKSLDNQRQPAMNDLVKDVKARMGRVEAAGKKVKGYLDGAIADARPLVDEADKMLKDGDPAQSRQAAIAALRILGPAERRADRRVEYDTQRAATMKPVQAVHGSKTVADKGAALDVLVAQADGLASVDQLKIEEGTQVLVDTKKQADTWLGLAATIANVQVEQPKAESELAALDKHAATAKVATEREAIRKLIADAKNFQTLAAGAPDPAAGWNAAKANIDRARADLAAAKKVADGMGAVAGAEAAAGNPGDLAGLKAALQKLKADGAVASKAGNAAAADAEFKEYAAQVAVADKALTDKDGKAAAAALAEAAKALGTAKTLQAEHGRFQETLKSVEAQLKTVKASPRAAKVQARIDPVEQGIAAAKASDQAKKGPEALVAVRAANDAIAAATKAEKDRKTYDDRAAAVSKRVAATKDATKKAALEKDVADATKLADALDFDGATDAIQQVEVKLDKEKLEGMMAAPNPDAKALKGMADLSKAMSQNGGAKTIDAMIQAVPDGGNADLIAAMATGRYGVKFTAGAALDAGGDVAKSMKVSCDMFSKIPEDIVKNKSITSVAFEDLSGGISAGHSYATAAVTMKGRAGTVTQEFGSNLKQPDPAGGPDVDQLGAVEEKCKPADENPVDFLNFAAAHEVGHGVDEERGFMKKHGKDADYGGWVTFGGNLQPLADAIGATAKFAPLYKLAAGKQYIVDKLQSRDPTPPALVPGSPEANAKRDFDLWHDMATSDEVCRRQSDSESLKLDDNKIYHEAYARVWVGYDAVARKRGLTGYQFRAPGEWFAELYAGYRSGKLKPDHPAMAWLTKL
jgi:hypothetical protein